MTMHTQGYQQGNPVNPGTFTLPLQALDHSMLAIAGGKAANLGELLQAGFRVPPGFCILTSAYNWQSNHLAPLQTAIDAFTDHHPEQVAQLARAAQAAFAQVSLPPEMIDEITGAYYSLADGTSAPVAVRSSATAEDLPYASFAGQQDTYLNIIGAEALLAAVRRCWASLWTERAISYRASLGLSQSAVSLAVVVQRMIESETAGVLFTANPLTGKRRQAVIDANPGLGEAVVSGATNPDHFIVNTFSGEIVERRLGDKRLVISSASGGGVQRTECHDQSQQASLSDTQIQALARLGALVEAHYQVPQDIEWAIDSSGLIWLTQSRPITTLYPLPDSAPQSDDELRVYFSISIFQGVYQPFTPMGISAGKLFASSVATTLGRAPHDPLNGPSILVDAASRLFLDVTSLLRSPVGRRLLIGAAGIGEALSAPLLQQVSTDPRLSLLAPKRWPILRAIGTLFAKTAFPLRLLQALVMPQAAIIHARRVKAAIGAETLALRVGSNAEQLSKLEQFSLQKIFPFIASMAPAFLCGLFSHALAGRLLGNLATPGEMQTVLRGLPHNPTTEMDLALWSLAQFIRADVITTSYVGSTAPEQMAQDYHTGTLPPHLQEKLTTFLSVYGHRGVAEIDLGVPRWSEDPTHILGVLANYLQLQDLNLSPDVQFRRGIQEAERMVASLTRRAARKNLLRGMLIGFLLRRARALAGLREMPKYCIVLFIARLRAVLWSVGQELEQAQRLDAAADIFFIRLPEVHEALAGKDLRPILHSRHSIYERELQRRHLPRLLLSDGTEPSVQTRLAGSAQGGLQGTPASPGQITARARVIFDPTGAHLEPGEILVAPSTDPGWTPLFLTASGLVMEMGGSISHGAVVAREYGIPAVVGVHGATEQITTGQLITVDGSTGTIRIEKEEAA